MTSSTTIADNPLAGIATGDVCGGGSEEEEEESDMSSYDCGMCEVHRTGGGNDEAHDDDGQTTTTTTTCTSSLGLLFVGGKKKEEEEVIHEDEQLRNNVLAFFNHLPDCDIYNIHPDQLAAFLEATIPPQHLPPDYVNHSKDIIFMKISEMSSGDGGKVSSAHVALLWEWVVHVVTKYRKFCERCYYIAAANACMNGRGEEVLVYTKVMKGTTKFKQFMKLLDLHQKPQEVDVLYHTLRRGRRLEYEDVIPFFVGREYSRVMRVLEEGPLPSYLKW